MPSSSTTVEEDAVSPSSNGSLWAIVLGRIRAIAEFADPKKARLASDSFSLVLSTPLLASAQRKLRKVMDETVLAVQRGLHVHPPQRVSDEDAGENGAYYLRTDKGRIAAVFKPSDEEARRHETGRNIVSDRTRREVAAFLVDREMAGVPATALAAVKLGDDNSLTKVGSVQKYVPHVGDASEFASSRFLKCDVHRIGILDIRVLNTDRNEQNMLVSTRLGGENGAEEEDSTEDWGHRLRSPSGDADDIHLVPIDHGLCLPDSLSDITDVDWTWLTYKQAKQPFDADTLEAIEAIDIDRDAQLLSSMGISQRAIHAMRCSTLFLKHAAAAGWTLNQIGMAVCRQYAERNTPSLVESIIGSGDVEVEAAIVKGVNERGNHLSVLS